MDLSNLSSNWRKLQTSLKTDAATNPAKRKADPASSNPRDTSNKKRKTVPDSNLTDQRPGPNGSQKHKLKLKLHQEGAKSPSNMGIVTSMIRSNAPSASLALWAEDNSISAKDLAAAYGTSIKATSIPDLKKDSQKANQGLSPTEDAGKYIAIDCEMVGVGPNPNDESALARVSIVNFHGNQLYDSFVQPKEAVTDYRTYVSGITPDLLQGARTFEAVQVDVAKLLDGKILIGHSVRNDLDALLLGHPKRDIRDTSRYAGYRQLAGGRTPGLKKLAREILGVDIQGGEHSSVEDARATMLLFRREKEGFERDHLKKWGPPRKALGVTAIHGSKRKSKRRKRKKK